MRIVKGLNMRLGNEVVSFPDFMQHSLQSQMCANEAVSFPDLMQHSLQNQMCANAAEALEQSNL